ncbi:MAG: MtrAB system response regulator MtrA [Pseudoclavibacter sp.]
MNHRILVVDDDRALGEMIGIVLRHEGWSPSFAYDGAQALARFEEVAPALVLLDVMLPVLDGNEVCRRLRAESGVPIIMLTARGDTDDVVSGLENGADDYVVKPFKPKELVARIRARLRGGTGPVADVLRLGDLQIDTRSHQVTRGDEAIALTPLEYDLLVVFASEPGVAFSRAQLLERVWDYHYQADTRLVNVHVQRLRAKIERNPEHPVLVTTVRGVGYRGVAGDE